MPVDNEFTKERVGEEESKRIEELLQNIDKDFDVKKPHRREFLLILASVITTYIGLTALHRRNPHYQKPENIGEVVSLNVGGYRIPPSNQGSFTYAGMPDNQRFLIMVENRHLYFPLDTNQILVGGYQFSVEKVTPNNIILKYLGKGISP